MKKIIGKTYLTIPHTGGKLAFEYPAFKGTYTNVVNSIDKAGLKRPSSSETASLIYGAWKSPDEKYSSEIISILKNNWFWEFTGNLYLPKSNGPKGVSSGEEISNGVILDLDSQNLKFENGPNGISSGVKLRMNKNSLVQRLKENDPLVKFVPFGFKTGEQTWQELEKNDYIQKRYGKEGAEKIAEIASKYKNNPYVNIFNSVNKEETRMSTLNYYWGFNNGLSVNGNDWSDNSGGHAFGVCKEKGRK